jgi:hypothetical protein
MVLATSTPMSSGRRTFSHRIARTTELRIGSSNEMPEPLLELYRLRSGCDPNGVLFPVTASCPLTVTKE